MRTYVVILCLSLGFALGGIAALNLWVDPFDVWNGPPRPGVNQVRPASHDFLRTSLPLRLAGSRAATFVVGSSRVLHGMPPAFRDQQGSLGLTAAFGGMNMAQARVVVRFLAEHTAARRVAVGLDLFGFGSATDDGEDAFDPTAYSGDPSLERLRRTLLSQAALQASLETWAASRRDLREPSEARQHTRSTEERYVLTLQRFLSMQGLYANFELSAAALQELDALLAECREANLEVVLFINPVHATLLELVRRDQLWPVFEAWKREASARASRHGVTVWDFAELGPPTTEAVREGMVHFPDDPSHYAPAVGHDLLARIGFEAELQGDEARRFGTRLETVGLEEHLQAIRSELAAWRADHDTRVVEAAMGAERGR